MAFLATELSDKINGYLSEMPYMREPKGLYAPIEYVLSLGGKRIRPVLMLLAYNMYKEDVDCILPQAAGIETYHNYTLLHDDLMDKADMRRNKPTVHKVWDDNTAILSGDAMLVLAYRLMADCQEKYLKRVMDIFTQTFSDESFLYIPVQSHPYVFQIPYPIAALRIFPKPSV